MDSVSVAGVEVVAAGAVLVEASLVEPVGDDVDPEVEGDVDVDDAKRLARSIVMSVPVVASDAPVTML